MRLRYFNGTVVLATLREASHCIAVTDRNISILSSRTLCTYLLAWSNRNHRSAPRNMDQLFIFTLTNWSLFDTSDNDKCVLVVTYNL